MFLKNILKCKTNCHQYIYITISFSVIIIHVIFWKSLFWMVSQTAISIFYCCSSM